MTVACPTCGATVEFRYDDSLVRVCAHCRSAVVRTDRGAESLGRFADPVAIESPLKLFADGMYGVQSFILIGMAQLQHPSGGIWQEWYAKLGSGTWGWLSEAQGRLYMTFERTDVAAPPLDQLVPNARVTIDGKGYFVGERGSATYISAMGEIPYKLVPRSQFWFADLSDGQGGFATIDYGEGGEPSVYVGQQIDYATLRISGGEAVATSRAAAGGALKCPNCGGSLELRAPDATLSIACPYCSDLISVAHGQLSIIARQGRKPLLDIALGIKGTLPEGEMTVIGYVGRSAHVDGTWYPFEEYLLHAPGIGFRWLVCSDSHWSYVQPIATGAVDFAGGPKYDGVTFKQFQRAALRVDYVVGELYWRVEVGEIVESADFIAPPAMLSREYTKAEQNWSLSTYMTPAEVRRAFADKVTLRAPIGIAPNQPYPGGVGMVIAVFTVALLAVGMVKCGTSVETVAHTEAFLIPAGLAPQPTPTTPATNEPVEPSGHVTFSKPFELEHKNIEVEVHADVSNNWAYFAIDLVNDKTGLLVSFDKSIEYYSGVEGGESWSEGSSRDGEVLAPLDPGLYVLRIEAQQGGAAPVSANVQVKQGVFRARWLLVALGLLGVPFLLVIWHAHSFHKRRWENSNVGGYSGGDD